MFRRGLNICFGKPGLFSNRCLAQNARQIYPGIIHGRGFLDRFVNEDKRAEIKAQQARKQQDLKKELERGYFGDFKEINQMLKSGIKPWPIAESDPYPADKSAKLRNLHCKSIDTSSDVDVVQLCKKNKLTLFLLAFRDYGRVGVIKWTSI